MAAGQGRHSGVAVRGRPGLGLSSAAASLADLSRTTFLMQSAFDAAAGAHAAELASLRAAHVEALQSVAAAHQRQLAGLWEDHASQLAAAAAAASMPAADQAYAVNGTQTEGGAGTAAAGVQTEPPEAGGRAAAVVQLQAEHERHVDELGVQFTEVHSWL